MTALTLFDVEPTASARRRDPATSKQAALSAAVYEPDRRERILAAFREHRRLTDDELCTALDVPVRSWPSFKTARSRLVKLGYLERANCGPRDGQTVWRLRAWEHAIERVEVAGERL